MDEFEMRAREFVAKRLSSEVGSANSLPIAIAAVAIDAANWARAECKAEIERLTGIINHNLAEARFGDGRHMHLYDECERLKAKLDTSEGALEIATQTIVDRCAELEQAKGENERLNAELDHFVKEHSGLLNARAGILSREHNALKQIDNLKRELEKARLQIISLEGNLGHSVPSGVKLPDVANNCLAEFIAKERDRLKRELNQAVVEGDMARNDRDKAERDFEKCKDLLNFYRDVVTNLNKHIGESGGLDSLDTLKKILVDNEELKAELKQAYIVEGRLRLENMDVTANRNANLVEENKRLSLTAVSDRAKIAKLEKDCNCYAQALAVALRDGIFTAKDRTKSDIEQIFARAALKDGGET